MFLKISTFEERYKVLCGELPARGDLVAKVTITPFAYLPSKKIYLFSIGLLETFVKGHLNIAEPPCVVHFTESGKIVQSLLKKNPCTITCTNRDDNESKDRYNVE